jgi:hypothetical protein
MNAALKLDYNKRFGAPVSEIAAEAMRNAATAKEAVVGPTKYSRWFFGEENRPGDQVYKPKLRPIDIGRMAAAEIGSITLSNLGILGDENYVMFASKLPQNHKMKKALHPALIVKEVAPWLGSCKIGEVRGGKKDGLHQVQQFFIGNFDAEINTSGKGGVYQIKSKDFSQVFYSLHMLIDDNNAFRGFDRSMGADGIAFQTDDMREAHFNIASAALGVPVEKLKEIARQQAAARRKVA